MDSICNEILFHICKYIEVKDAINVSILSKQFYELVNDDLLWKIYYERDYEPLKVKELCGKQYKVKYFKTLHYIVHIQNKH